MPSVNESVKDSFESFAISKPMIIEPILSAIHAQNTSLNELASKARSFITSAAIMASIKNNEKRLKNGSLLIANSLLKWRRLIPMATGTKVITNSPSDVVNIEKLASSCGANWCMAKPIIHGVVIMLIAVEAAVKLTESAKLAFASWLTTFDIVPPGHAAKIINPIAIGVGKLSK